MAKSFKSWVDNLLLSVRRAFNGQEAMATINTHHRALIGVFASEEEAIRAQSALVRNGIHPNAVAISIDLTRDGIAAEAPGQAYENQGGTQDLWQLLRRGVDVDPDTEEARVLADVERGSVVLTVDRLAASERAAVLFTLKEYKALAIRGVHPSATLSGCSTSSSPTQSS